mmetsp:Transcript_5121/g.9802  ORF Transcript_5121/g.9802 Transcript_5121/m.9802 type:complete len:98 (-) Transcript_5121:245-538(-)
MKTAGGRFSTMRPRAAAIVDVKIVLLALGGSVVVIRAARKTIAAMDPTPTAGRGPVLVWDLPTIMATLVLSRALDLIQALTLRVLKTELIFNDPIKV